MRVADAAARVWASQEAPVTIGFLHSGSRGPGRNVAAFKEGMLELGRKEGVEYVLEERYADGRLDRLASFAQELAAIKPALIVAAMRYSVVAGGKRLRPCLTLAAAAVALPTARTEGRAARGPTRGPG